MVLICIEAVALVLQLFAVALAFRLNRLIGKRLAWGILVLAMLVMALRRALSLYRLLTNNPVQPFLLDDELLSLLISALMLLGVAGITPVFARLTRISAQLGESRAMLANILNSVPQAICWKDRNGVFLGCNTVFSRLCGFDQPDQIVGKTEYDLPWREHAATTQAEEAEIIAQNAPRRYLLEPSQREAGASRWIDATKGPLMDTHGAKREY